MVPRYFPSVARYDISLRRGLHGIFDSFFGEVTSFFFCEFPNFFYPSFCVIYNASSATFLLGKYSLSRKYKGWSPSLVIGVAFDDFTHRRASRRADVFLNEEWLRRLFVGLFPLFLNVRD